MVSFSTVPKAIWTAQGWGLVLLTFMSFFPKLFHFQEYALFSLLAMAMGTAWLNGGTIWVRTPIDLPLWSFVGWVLLTIPFAIDPAYSFAEWRKLVAQILVFYWALLVLHTHDRKPFTDRILMAVVIGTALLSMYALVDFEGRGGSLKDRPIRAEAPSSGFQELATYLVIAIPLIVTVGVAMRAWWQRLTCWSIFALALLAQFFSYTRAGWLALVAEGLAVGFFTGRRRLVGWVLGCCLVGVVSLLVLSQSGYQRSTVDPWTLHARLAVWNLGIQEIMAHPLIGVGYGKDTYITKFAEYPETAAATHLHNTFLMVAMGSGIPALVFLIWVFAKSILVMIHSARRLCDKRDSVLLMGLAVMIMGFTVRNFFDDMFTGSLAHLFWILMATGLVPFQLSSPNKERGDV